MESKNKKILLIEDEKIIADLLSDEFETAGYEVAIAADGEEGISLIGSFEPDVVILDLLLPKKTGYQVVQELHDDGSIEHLPLFVLSNSGKSSEVELLLRLGVREVLTKVNFNPTDVVEKVGVLFTLDDFMKNDTPSDEGALFGDASTDNDGEKPCVMIVEDDPFIGDILLSGFTDHFVSHKVLNTQEADQVFEEQKIDALILDVMLPGKDGITYLKEIRQREELKDLIVVLASNLGQKSEIESGMDAGANDYIIKANFLPEEIAQRVYSLLAQKKASL